MDPITLILSSLAAGAAAAAKDTASTAVKDAYQALKSLVQHHFSGKSEAEVALANYEKKPEVWKEPVKDALTQTGADSNESIIKAARALMAQVNPEDACGHIEANFNAPVQGAVIGKNCQATMTFNDKPK
jgi:hypothetical protein